MLCCAGRVPAVQKHFSQSHSSVVTAALAHLHLCSSPGNLLFPLGTIIGFGLLNVCTHNYWNVPSNYLVFTNTFSEGPSPITFYFASDRPAGSACMGSTAVPANLRCYQART